MSRCERPPPVMQRDPPTGGLPVIVMEPTSTGSPIRHPQGTDTSGLPPSLILREPTSAGSPIRHPEGAAAGGDAKDLHRVASKVALRPADRCDQPGPAAPPPSGCSCGAGPSAPEVP